MKIYTLIKYAIERRDAKAEFISTLFSALDQLEEVDLVKRAKIFEYIEKALDCFQPEDLGLTDWL